MALSNQILSAKKFTYLTSVLYLPFASILTLGSAACGMDAVGTSGTSGNVAICSSVRWLTPGDTERLWQRYLLSCFAKKK